MSNTYPFHSNCGCLHSESTTALRKVTGNSSQEMQLNCNYDQTHLHDLSDADSLKKIFISKESIHVLKLNTLRKRMIITLNGIQSLLSNRPQPDGVEDLKRRQQRAAEFSARFCRNYLYQLQRQMNIITKMWKNSSVNHTHSSYFILCQKVITTHQNAHLALQAYLHHMPCSVENGVPDKLEELLEVVHSLCCVCSKLDMSEGDSDCNSERVKQQCEQLMLQIKSGVTVEESESCATMSHVCAQKINKTSCKKHVAIERYSMYSRNPCYKSNCKQYKNPAKILVTSRKRPSETHSRKHYMTTATDSKKSNIPGNHVIHKTHERIMREDTELGEVCATDNVRTVMESFLDIEVPEHSEIPSKVPCSRKATYLLQKDDELIVPSLNTLKKLESEIKNLKEQTKSLKEMGHPNYSVYIRTLETMSHQLSRMKSSQQTSDTSPNISKTKHVVNKKSNIEFPKNVKLICLTSANEDESKGTCKKYLTTLKSSEVQEINVVEQEDNSLLSASQQENDDFNNGKFALDLGQRDGMPPSIEKFGEQRNRTFIESFVEKSSSDLGVHIQYSNIAQTATTRHGRMMDYESKHLQRWKEPVKLSVTHHDKSSAFLYHQVFQNYMNSNSLYNESIKPWHMVTRLANRLIDNVLQDVALNDTGIQKITSGLLRLEFQ